MTDLLGFLELRGGCDCDEVINHCPTLAYIEGTRCGWQVAAADCPDCCCAAHDDGYGSRPSEGPNPAPWYDVAQPASDEFFGLYGDLTLSKAQADTAAGSVETIIDTYLQVREDGERFLDTVRRLGIHPFKEKLYAAH